MPDLTTRTFRVCFESPINAGTHNVIAPVEREVKAAYYQEGGIGGIVVNDDGSNKRFMVFKDVDHKPVFTVRAASVITIEEIREVA